MTFPRRGTSETGEKPKVKSNKRRKSVHAEHEVEKDISLEKAQEIRLWMGVEMLVGPRGSGERVYMMGYEKIKQRVKEWNLENLGTHVPHLGSLEIRSSAGITLQLRPQRIDFF